MADKKLNIKVSTTGASKSQKNLKGLSGSIKTLGKAALATGAAYFATRGLINGFSSALRLAGEQEQAEKKLEVALGKTSKALLDHASSLQKVTTFGDEAIIGVQASLAAFLDSEDAIKKATEATLDISVAMGMDLKAAGDLVAKTLGSSTNAMSRYGIQVEGAVGSTERLESLTGNVAKLFGGQAKAQADTYAGSVEQMKNSLGDMGEQIGAIIIPVFEKLEPHLSLAIDFWSKYFGSLKDGKEEVKDHSFAIEQLGEQIAFQVSLIDGLTAANLFNQRHTKEGLGLLERARAEKRDAIDQLKAEKIAIGELIAERFNLIKLQERDLEIKKALNIEAVTGLELRRAEIDMNIEYVDVIDPATRGNSLFAASFHDIAGASSTALRQTSDLLAATSGASKKQQVQAMRLAQFAAIADTASGVMKAFKQGGTLGFVTGAGIAAAGAAQIATIQDAIASAQSVKAAAFGANEIVNKPTMFLTGEAGPERVQVTPLTPGMNKNGPGGITVNVGRFIGSQENADELANIIENRSRLGFNRIATHA